ncbi:NlpC/P60 family peptidoglycan-binding protein RipD [Mycobacterium branderi]|uniref:Hydrolase n=1 Tax=Mycobacterium branderi TaxID=43348 RepID=A0A7I7WB26_9MYCO|nr:NlpC/P60 family peptidoglycan-binding protein RipD [Mycobacterium branderi]MCV7235809.1 NlpC/P60 family peptidoglycan-binding protein RipD [Mycobacterium branderi]ORA35193.1 hydrolase [Mycobacterium branderi]BBZ13975.1 hydrolase [Mycobacterium branderi]
MKRVYAVAASLAVLAAPAVVNPGVAAADQRTGYGQPIDVVIQRALSQRGVPYVYGGGNASGPTNGVRQSANSVPGVSTVPRAGTYPGTPTLPGAATVPNAGTVGFDASGLVQYAFAGAGIKMPRTSGQQCNVGRKVPPAQARRGDLICYGPGGSQSVAIYLGNGQMIEATEPAVTVSAARTTNMTPYLTRIIE